MELKSIFISKIKYIYDLDHFYRYRRKYCTPTHFIFGFYCDFSRSLANYYSLTLFLCRVRDIAITFH